MPKMSKMTKLPKIKDISHIIKKILASGYRKATEAGFISYVLPPDT
jgi:hypothetical protein